MNVFVKLLIAIGCTILSRSTMAQDAPSLQDVVSGLKKRHEELENLHVKAVWTEFANGQYVATERQEIHVDSLGRIRVNYTVEQPNSLPRRVEECYDGEVTVFFKQDPSRDRLGATRASPDSTETDIFRSAVLNPGLFPAGQGPSKHRNPFTFLSETVISELQTAVNRGTPSVQISPVESQPGLWKLTYKSPHDETGDQDCEVIIDEKKGWVILSHDIMSAKDGRHLVKKYTEFVLHEDVWLPASGGWKPGTPDSSGQTSLEWRFSVTEMAIDSADFDESVFTISLPAGTYVTDNRHNVSYWAGSGASIGDDTTRLAQVAVTEREARLREINSPPPPINLKPGNFSKWLMGINLLVLVAAIAGALWRSRKRA